MKTNVPHAVLRALSHVTAVALIASSIAIGGEPPMEREAVTAQAGTNAASGSAQASGGARGFGGAQAGGSGGGTRGGGGVGSGGGFVGPRGSYSFSGQVAPYDRPAVIVTQTISAKTHAEWKEDLSVMDKLLGDEIVRVSGESVPQAMGIRLTMFGYAAPMYLEGCGAVFSSTVNLPLAAAEKSTPKAEDKSGGLTSAWDRAKSAIAGENRIVDRAPVASGRAVFPPLKFEQTKVDELVNAILKVLPEGKNIRHLQEDEFIIVTIAGYDDAGAPLRLTLKAKKSDIDRAANGGLTPDDFKARVARRTG